MKEKKKKRECTLFREFQKLSIYFEMVKIKLQIRKKNKDKNFLFRKYKIINQYNVLCIAKLGWKIAFLVSVLFSA